MKYSVATMIVNLLSLFTTVKYRANNPEMIPRIAVVASRMKPLLRFM